jgi:cobalt-zinc-cadmium resistance protein CzcA
MLERIISTTLHRRGPVLVLVLLIIAAGIYAVNTIPIDAFPDVTNNQVEVVCRAEGWSALEIERSVTMPVETAMRGLPGVTQMRSVTKFGLTIVTIIFEEKMDVYFARQLVFERLAEARESIPAGVETELGPIATAMGEIYQYTIEGKRPADSTQLAAYLTELRTVQDWTITPLLKSVPGVNEINSFGGYFKQYQIIVSPERLVKYDITLDQVTSAVERNNRNAGGNILERHADQYIVRGVGLICDVRDIGDVVVKSVAGSPVLIRDIAEVRIGTAVRMGSALKNGTEECVGGIVMMLRGENSREVAARVREKVREINESGMLPAGLRIAPYYDRSDIVGSSVGAVARTLLEGSVLVLIVLYLLLRSFRGSVIVLAALPLAMLTTFIVMKSAGLSANLMSLGGLAISIGMIIDATIIQVENVQRHLALCEGVPSISVILRAVLEVRKPSIFGELIIAITFVPIFALEGIEGRMFTPLALTVVIALVASLLLSIFVIPVLCTIVMKPQEERMSVVMRAAQRWYRPMLEWALKSRGKVIGAAVALLAFALFLVPRLGTEFIPTMDEEAFDMDVALLPGVSLDKSMEINKLIGEKLMRFPELQTIVGRVGQSGVALDTRGVDKTGYVGVLRPRSEWPRSLSREEFNEEMREALSTIPGIGFGFSQPIQCRIDELVAGTRAQLIVRVHGNDLDVLNAKAGEIARVLQSMEGCADLMVEKVKGQPYLTINIDRKRIARYGLNVEDIQDVIETAIAGRAASKLFEENRSVDMVVRLPEDRRNSVDAIASIPVTTSTGANIPLAQLADVAMTEGPVQISREDGIRRVGIELNISGRDIGGFVAEAKQRIRERVHLPSGTYLTWGGQFENQQRAMNKLMVIGPIAVLLILLLLYLSFRSIRDAVMVIMNLPFALIGGVVSLWISGQYLSIPASVGFIVLFGVAVLNGVVLLTRINQLRADGIPVNEAVREGAMSRLRPVLMTALISVFSLLPMLFATGAGTEIQKPLATVVVGGLITSTMLTLLVLPVVYGWKGGRNTEPEPGTPG